MESIDVLPPEKIAFIAYNIGVYESVQKFGGLITSGKITIPISISILTRLSNYSTMTIYNIIQDSQKLVREHMLSGIVLQMSAKLQNYY